MSSKVTKHLRQKREQKLKLTKAINHLAVENGSQIKSALHFQEFTVGTQVSSSIGNFEIIKELAVGRCCEVYIGEELTSKQREAIKVFVRKQHYKGALLRELKFLGKLSPHPHIVTPRGYFQFEGRDVLVHELLSCTVKDVQMLHENRPPSVWLLTTLARHLMRGLAHMHKNGIVHGDIKPHNIMWSGLEETFKLIDFGVSFSLSENMEHAIQSRVYQAPETIQWNQWVQTSGIGAGQPPSSNCQPPAKPGAEADVWSAGCIISELLTGSKLFTFGWNGENVEQVLKDRLEVVEEDFSPEFVSQWFSWFRKCLEDRMNRWSAEEADKDPLLSEVKKGSERASMYDLLTLPTTVLRVVGLVKPDMDQEFANELVEAVVELANSSCEGTISPVEYTFYNPNGSLYMVYENANRSHSAYEKFRRSIVKGYTLALTFFPKEFYEESRFF